MVHPLVKGKYFSQIMPQVPFQQYLWKVLYWLIKRKLQEATLRRKITDSVGDEWNCREIDERLQWKLFSQRRIRTTKRQICLKKYRTSYKTFGNLEPPTLKTTYWCSTSSSLVSVLTAWHSLILTEAFNSDLTLLWLIPNSMFTLVSSVSLVLRHQTTIPHYCIFIAKVSPSLLVLSTPLPSSWTLSLLSVVPFLKLLF